MPAGKKSNTNFVAEAPKEGWAYFPETDEWRRTPYSWGAPGGHFPKEYGDWLAVSKQQGWQPPDRAGGGAGAGQSLLRGGGEHLSATESSAGGGSGGGMKIGAGRKPQPYGWHGWYGETGGGISGGPEVRGKVTPPAKGGKAAPAKPAARGKVTWNSSLKPSPSEQQLESNMRGSMRTVGEGKDLNVSSAYRPDENAARKKAMGRPVDPHSEGRAVDINYVNGAHIAEVANKGGPKDAELRRQVEEMQARAARDPEVQAFISPYGGFFRNESKRKSISALSPESPDVKQHWNHVHIAVFKK